MGAIYTNKILNAVNRLHEDARNKGTVNFTHNRKKYSMVFSQSCWIVTDEQNDEVLRINIRPITKAKKFFKEWMDS